MENYPKASSELTIAVLPFENLSENNKQDVFCKSFCQDIITELSRFKQFQIIAYDSIKDLPAQASSKDEPLQKLNSDYFIKGSFLNHNQFFKINAQLVNSHNGRVIWADRVEGELETLLILQEDLLLKVVASLQQQLQYDLLSQMRKKLPVQFKAYESWLYGMEELKKGTLESDEKAREYFQQAIEVDPHYSLAYSGMSLTYFNEWSCQLWERWEASQKGAYEWAKKAIELDDQNYVAATVLARILLYVGEYEMADFYLQKSLHLNPNDPQNLIQIAACFNYLGISEEAYQLYERAVRINPSKAEKYHPDGAVILFELGKYEDAIRLATKGKDYYLVDMHGYVAATYFHLGNYEKMQEHLELFLDIFQKKINKGKPSTIREALDWMSKVNPNKRKTNLQAFWDFVNGNTPAAYPKTEVFSEKEIPEYNLFLKETDYWRLSYEGQTVHMIENKGFLDIQKLLENPNQAFHCSELMGSALVTSEELVFDEKAKKTYQKKILELQEELSTAEAHNDLARSTALQEEYDRILSHLSTALGLKGKTRSLGNLPDKARSAVTWRIRNAIKKIEKQHPSLGRHLDLSIKTGMFCTYAPEKMIKWMLN